jgi:hypothetical protein
MDKKDIMLFCAILEATERFGIVRTIDKQKPLLEVIASPYYKDEIEEVFELLSKTIPFKILEVKENED